MLSIVNSVGENNVQCEMERTEIDTIRFFFCCSSCHLGFGFKTLRCSLFNMQDLDLEEV